MFLELAVTMFGSGSEEGVVAEKLLRLRISFTDNHLRMAPIERDGARSTVIPS